MGGPSDLYRQVEHYREAAWKAEAEAERLTRERDEARENYAALRRQYTQLEQEAHKDVCQLQADRDRLRALLREVEWTDHLSAHRRCPICGGQPYGPWRGHQAGCRLAAALEER